MEPVYINTKDVKSNIDEILDRHDEEYLLLHGFHTIF